MGLNWGNPICCCSQEGARYVSVWGTTSMTTSSMTTLLQTVKQCNVTMQCQLETLSYVQQKILNKISCYDVSCGLVQNMIWVFFVAMTSSNDYECTCTISDNQIKNWQ